MADDNRVLYYIDELSGYKVDSDYSDVRGWKVVDSDNRTIGEVDNLLVNKNTERVVYLDVEVDDSLASLRRSTDVPANEGTHGFINKDGENHLIIPIGKVTLDEDNKKVYTGDIDHERFMRTQWIPKGSRITRDYERSVFKNYFPDGTYDDNDDDNSFYNRSEFGMGRPFGSGRP